MPIPPPRQRVARVSRTPAPAATKGQRAARASRIAAMLTLATGPTRLEILLLLADSDRYATEVVEMLGRHSQPTTSHQLALLRHGGLVEAIREGVKLRYRLTEAGRQLVRAVEAAGRINKARALR